MVCASCTRCAEWLFGFLKKSFRNVLETLSAVTDLPDRVGLFLEIDCTGAGASFSFSSWVLKKQRDWVKVWHKNQYKEASGCFWRGFCRESEASRVGSTFCIFCTRGTESHFFAFVSSNENNWQYDWALFASSMLILYCLSEIAKSSFFSHGRVGAGVAS